ncbi:MAG: SemiSWEET transporter [Bacteroidota bacterium]
MNNYTEVIGILAGTLTTLAFLPQVIQVYRTKSTGDISVVMYTIFCTGVSLWIVYGVLRGALPVIIANSITLVLAAAVLGMKLAWDDQKSR